MAHAIDYENGKLSLSENFQQCYSEALDLLSSKELTYEGDNLNYYLNDPIEYFAESYALYKMKTDIIKESAPLTYEFFETYMK